MQTEYWEGSLTISIAIAVAVAGSNVAIAVAISCSGRCNVSASSETMLFIHNCMKDKDRE